MKPSVLPALTPEQFGGILTTGGHRITCNEDGDAWIAYGHLTATEFLTAVQEQTGPGDDLASEPDLTVRHRWVVLTDYSPEDEQWFIRIGDDITAETPHAFAVTLPAECTPNPDPPSPSSATRPPNAHPGECS